MTISEVIMPFGKYQGLSLDDVPATYLLWLDSQDWVSMKFPEIYEYIQKNIDAIKMDVAMDDEDRGIDYNDY